MVNNVFYNAARWSEITDKYGQGNQQINIVNNYYKPGPSSGNKGYKVFYYSNTGRHPVAYVKGNIDFHRTSDSHPQEMIVREDSRWMISNSRFQAPPITMVSAPEVFDLVVANAGATVPMRNAVDRRIVQDVKHETGRVINDPSEVGGWPELDYGIAPSDSDRDGMPDEWEDSYGLDKQNPADGAAYRNDSDETYLDEYLNELVATRNESTSY